MSMLLVVVALTGCATPPATAVAEKKSVVLRAHYLVWSKGDFSRLEELYAPEFVGHHIVGPDWRGPEGVRREVLRYRAAFPDWAEEVEEILAEGNRVMTRFTVTGTHEGEFAGIAPTGRRVRMEGVAVYRVVGGRIVEQWSFPDLLSLLQQLQSPASPTN